MRLLATLMLLAAVPALARDGAAKRSGVIAGAHAARPAGDPAAPVREAYRLDRAAAALDPGPRRRQAAPWEPPHRTRLFSRRLAALLETDDRYSQQTGEVGVVDGDPLFDAQEYEDGAFDTLSVAVAERQGDRAEVLARFKNYATREVRFLMIREGARWVIDDIVTGAPTPASLTAQLSQPHFCTRGWTGPCRDP